MSIRRRSRSSSGSSFWRAGRRDEAPEPLVREEPTKISASSVPSIDATSAGVMPPASLRASRMVRAPGVEAGERAG